jgi:hypothetical protein
VKLFFATVLTCLIALGGKASANRPEFLFGGITVFFRQGTTSKQITQLCSKFGFFEAPLNYQYDPTALVEQADTPIYVWHRSSAPPLPQWIDLIVPFGQENRWIDILKAQTGIVSDAVRIEVPETKGGEEELKFPDVDEKATAGVFTATVSGSMESAFERFASFLQNRFPRPAVTFDDERYKDRIKTNQRLFRVNHARHAVLRSGWQNLIFSVVVVHEGKDACMINVSIIGKGAPGFGESHPPDFSEYDEDLVTNDSDALQQFAATMKDGLKNYLGKNL